MKTTQTQTELKPLFTPEQTKALGLYLRQFKPDEIATGLGVSVRTVQHWINHFGWRALREDCPIELLVQQRVAYLLWIEEKHESQLKELEILLDQKRKRDEAKPRRSKEPRERKERRGRPTNSSKNDISGITAEMLRTYREKTFREYQLEIYNHKCDDSINETRFYLKSRQIGLTYYFAFEAFEDAVLSGANQVFLSASRKQSEIFKNYIRRFALEIGDVELKGKDDLQLSNGATLLFLSTNASTSQGFNGHVYFDETFWIPKFKEFNKLTNAMSVRGSFRTTYLSTPSTTAHEAYPLWSGDKALNIDISRKALKNGSLGTDGIFRQIITIDDAIKKGGAADFNMEKLHRKFPIKEEFDNLLRCKFLDDATSFFSIKKLLACKTDASIWRDVNFKSIHPVGSAEVLVGYDPRGGGQGQGSDDAGLVVALKPKNKGSTFRLIEKIRLKGSSYEQQAQVIKDICQKYNVVYMALDTTGVGSSVAELVRKFYPSLVELNYSPDLKRVLAYKAREIIGAGRLQFPCDWDDLVHSFLMIRQQTTDKSNQVTFMSARNKTGSHADLAWAAMHIMYWEPIDILNDTETSVSFF
ncbi:terminase large subunit domain-containing protein [Vibrio sp. OPT18]|uniref:terminase large subunit domain-containing protein n=1 Tax=Vibrio sp. OPT18 TaxID=2778641 RepID=UPI00187E0FB1|nr:terminase family protein [Vibrio sp. OPT18]MBE8574453.1 terminase [Vibrio sp. OPT18]